MKIPTLATLAFVAGVSTAAAQAAPPPESRNNTPGSAPAAPAVSPAVAPAIEPGAPAVIPVGSRVGELPSGYDSGGRRDPFLSLVQTRRSFNGPAMDPNMRARTGLSTLSVNDVNIKGITKAGPKSFAIVEGPNSQSFVAHLQDKLSDAAVKSIDAQGVVFVDQTGNEVRKTLRPTGEVIR